jgi:hypothetical protein
MINNFIEDILIPQIILTKFFKRANIRYNPYMLVPKNNHKFTSGYCIAL